MYLRFFSKFLILFFIYSSFDVQAITTNDISKLHQKEQYQEIIDSLKNSDEKLIPKNIKHYYLGLSYSKLRDYEQAVIHFKIASKNRESLPDLNYEYGQALFANNNLKKARYEFSKSAGKNFNYTASIYYMAYISELLDDKVMAKYNYKRLIIDKRTDKKILQVALFNYSKILMQMMRSDFESMKRVERNLVRLDVNLPLYVPRYIFPLLDKAYNLDPTSQVGIEVEQLRLNLLNEFKLDPNVLVNGRRISPERLYASVAQKFKYDTNVNQSGKASALNETEVFARYNFVIKKKMIMTPELRLTYEKYSDQETPSVFYNDSLNYTFAIRNKFEHKFMNRPASFLLDIEHSSVYKDWEMGHQRKYFSTTNTLGIGEQFSVTELGDSYLRMRLSDYKDETGISNYKAFNLSAEQYFFLVDGTQLIITTFDMGRLNYYENELLNYNTYTARVIYLLFEFIPTYTAQIIISTTLSDTLKQKELKGLELLVNPSIDISKAITNNLRLSVNYSYTENSSKQIESRYYKSIVGTEISYSF